MNWFGILVGATSFLVIGIFHPIVIRCEYHFSAKVWPLFLLGGLACCGISLLVEHDFAAAALAIVGFCMLWSILELKHQAERVRKGWFPMNPKRMPAGDARAQEERADK